MLKKQLLKFALKLFLFVLILVVSDTIFGIVFHRLLNEQTDGRFYKIAYSLDKSKEDIIIIGSSRGEINYNPSIVSKELGMSCWNASRGGQTIPYMLLVEKEILNRFSPKIIVLNIDPVLLQEPIDYDQASILRPFSKYHPRIYELLSRKDWSEKYKLLSNIYIYNSMMFYFLRPFFIKNKDGDPIEKGWKPRKGIISSSQIAGGDNALDNEKYNELNPIRVDFFNQMIDDAKRKNILLVMSFSPNYFPIKRETVTMAYVKKWSGPKKYPVFDFSNDTTLIQKREYFYDLHHMNDVGAKLFSQMLADSISQLVEYNKLK